MFFKNGVLKISQNSQENTCARVSFLIKMQAKAPNMDTFSTVKMVNWEEKAIIENIFSFSIIA